ncbi:MAG: hypothetical protein EON89_02605 [Brevundimonas sp.]|nr:MAG: hypothetical protein EON89_02605 [Brevundimonas sp.]
MLIALVAALLLQQTPAQPTIVWSTPVEAPPAAPATPPPPIPDWARADPFGYERSECSPLIRKAEESQDACQARVRTALAANLGAALPDGLKPAGATTGECRQTAAGDRYALQCGTPARPDRPVAASPERTCETRPQAQPGGGVVWQETCRPADGSAPADEGLRVRIGRD